MDVGKRDIKDKIAKANQARYKNDKISLSEVVGGGSLSQEADLEATKGVRLGAEAVEIDDVLHHILIHSHHHHTIDKNVDHITEEIEDR